jgi:hypothetical protein
LPGSSFKDEQVLSEIKSYLNPAPPQIEEAPAAKEEHPVPVAAPDPVATVAVVASDPSSVPEASVSEESAGAQNAAIDESRSEEPPVEKQEDSKLSNALLHLSYTLLIYNSFLLLLCKMGKSHERDESKQPLQHGQSKSINC